MLRKPSGAGTLESAKAESLAQAMAKFTPPTGDVIEDTTLLDIIGNHWELPGGGL